MEKEMMKEQLSAMLDGELDAAGVAHVFNAFGCPGLQDEAEIYFLVGDVLRKGERFQIFSRNLTDVVRKRLQSETYLSVELGEPCAVNESGQMAIDI
ncbi:sigma-E factor negative regulatory protein [Oxalobacter sp. OttesenSCG-928-P03]|nr:sigma-E factor negative regulatory protein [Oxalobacter sp. OttesenSCG-928-P03]